MTNSTLEKVARALAARWFRAKFGYAADHPNIAAYAGQNWRSYESAARTAVEALRQVDDETVEAMIAAILGDAKPEASWKEIAADAFTAAIDHILTEGGEG